MRAIAILILWMRISRINTTIAKIDTDIIPEIEDILTLKGNLHEKSKCIWKDRHFYINNFVANLIKIGQEIIKLIKQIKFL